MSKKILTLVSNFTNPASNSAHKYNHNKLNAFYFLECPQLGTF